MPVTRLNYYDARFVDLNESPSDPVSFPEYWTVVGDPDTLLWDQSDATYVDEKREWIGEGLGSEVLGPTLWFRVPSLTAAGFNPDTDTIVSIRHFVRYDEIENTRPAGNVGPSYFQWYWGFGGFGGGVPIDLGLLFLDTSPGIHELDATIYAADDPYQYGSPSIPASLFDDRYNGDQVIGRIYLHNDYISDPSAGITRHRIYEAWMEVDWVGVAIYPPTQIEGGLGPQRAQFWSSR